MDSTEHATELNRTARMAGLFYLIVVVTGIFSLLYVPSQISTYGEATTVISGIQESGWLFRLGIVAGLICYTAFLVLPFVLYKLLHRVGREAAVLMVAFAVASVPISFISLLSKLDVLSLVSGADHLQVFTPEQVYAQMRLLLDAYGNGVLVAQIFWGLWLLPFGYLVFKSGFLPRILGILLMMGCFGYLIDFFGRVLFSGYSETLATIVGLPASLGEIGICLWLLIVGVRQRTAAATDHHLLQRT